MGQHFLIHFLRKLVIHLTVPLESSRRPWMHISVRYLMNQQLEDSSLGPAPCTLHPRWKAIQFFILPDDQDCQLRCYWESESPNNQSKQNLVCDHFCLNCFSKYIYTRNSGRYTPFFLAPAVFSGPFRPPHGGLQPPLRGLWPSVNVK